MNTKRLMLPVLLAGTFMGFLDLFLVIVAVPTIASGLHASVATTQLVLSLYVVAYGAALVIGGRLGDRLGRRRLYAWGMAIFTLASAGCACSPTVGVLIAMRIVQGIGGALMLPQVLATVRAVLDGRERQRAILLYTTVLGLAGALGQVIGGGLIALDVLDLSWRALFLINVPIGIATLALIPGTVPETTSPQRVTIDVPGAIALAVSLVLVLLGLGTGPSHGWPTWSWLMVLVGLAVAAPLPLIERRQRTPLLPPALARQRSVRLGLAATLAFYAANNVVFVGLTLYLQDGLHIGALGAGAGYLPLGVAYMLCTLALRRPSAPTGSRAMLIGSATMAAGLTITIVAALSHIGPVALASLFAVFGAGLGLVYPTIVATVLECVDPGDEGAATGLLLTTTQVSNALGIAIAAAAWAILSRWPAADRLAIELTIAGVLIAGVAAASVALSTSRSSARVRHRADDLRLSEATLDNVTRAS